MSVEDSKRSSGTRVRASPGVGAAVAAGVEAGVEVVATAALLLALLLLLLELVGLEVGLEVGLWLLEATGAGWVLGTTGPAGVTLGVAGMMVGAGVASGAGVAPGGGGAGTAAATAAVLTVTACVWLLRHSLMEG